LYLDARESLGAILHVKRTAGKGSGGYIVWEGLYSPTAKVKKSVQLSLEGISVETVKGKVPREGLEFDEVARACIACQV